MDFPVVIFVLYIILSIVSGIMKSIREAEKKANTATRREQRDLSPLNLPPVRKTAYEEPKTVPAAEIFNGPITDPYYGEEDVPADMPSRVDEYPEDSFAGLSEELLRPWELIADEEEEDFEEAFTEGVSLEWNDSPERAEEVQEAIHPHSVAGQGETLLDLQDQRILLQGIILKEILGPPRALKRRRDWRD